MARTKQQPEPAPVVECAVPFGCQVDGVLRSVRHGERLRTDDPAYKAAPQYFAALGIPTAEKPRMQDFIAGTGHHTQADHG